MKTFLVLWKIDIEAETAEEAAAKALEIQRDPNSIATVFEVAERMGDRNLARAPVRVDVSDFKQ